MKTRLFADTVNGLSTTGDMSTVTTDWTGKEDLFFQCLSDMEEK